MIESFQPISIHWEFTIFEVPSKPTELLQFPKQSAIVSLYAITTSKEASRVSINSDLSSRNIFWLVYNDLAVAVSYSVDPTLMLVKTLNQYESSLQAIHDQYDVLPMRYGTCSTISQLPQWINQQREDLLRKLNATAGCSEILLRWHLSKQQNNFPETNIYSSHLIHAPSGREYLIQKMNVARRENIVDQRIQEVEKYIQAELRGYLKGIQTSAKRISLANHTAANASQCSATKSSLQKPDIPLESILAADILVIKSDVAAVIELCRHLVFQGHEPATVRGPLPIFAFSKE